MMDIGSQLIDAATLMATGMAVVFTFLTLLVYLVRLMSRCLPEQAPPELTPPKVTPRSANLSATDPQVIAAISAAVHLYRNSKA